MTIARGLAAIAMIAAAGSSALADELIATRNQELDEVSHTVTVRLLEGVATYTVQRQFQNRGKLAEEARLSIHLPAGAAATGLRIRASGKWHTGELLDREVAAERYRELTGAGVYDPKDPALLYWISASELRLQMFPVFPGTTSTVEYTLTVPTRYAAGRYWLTYPRVDPTAPARFGTRKLVDPVVAVHPGWMPSAGGLVIDGKPAEPGKPIALAPPGRPPWPSAGMDDSDALVPYSVSAIDVPASRGDLRYTSAKLRVELHHPSPSDLSLGLLVPTGELLHVSDADAGAPDTPAVFDVRLLEATRPAGRWRLVVRGGGAESAGALVRWSLAFGDRTFGSADTPVFLHGGRDGQAVAAIGVEAPPMAAWSGRLGRVVASGAHAFSRLELDVAPRVSAVPKRAQVVFVLDASYSAGPQLLDAQLAIVRAYLAHVPDAELEVVAVRRTARRLFGRFVTAAEAPRLLDAAVRAGALALGNGSALDDGARLAASLLAGRAGPQRVVLATDEMLRPALTDAAALASLAALAPDAVVHVVVPSAAGGDLPSLERDDAAGLAVLATGHHGILARVSGLPAKAPDLEPVVLELVRPTRIEQVAIAGTSPLSVPDVLREGEGVRLFEAGLTAAAAPAAVSLTGKLWSDPIRLDLTAGAAFSTATAAFVFGADLYTDLSEAEQRTVALAGRAVSPVTSYLAIEPGVRPSKIGLEEGEGGFGWGAIGSGSYGTLGGAGGLRGRAMDVLDLASLIPTDACVRRHAPSGSWSVQLAIHTTKDEIVDVEPATRNDPLAACLAEAAWSVRLPTDVHHRHRDQHTVRLSGP